MNPQHLYSQRKRPSSDLHVTNWLAGSTKMIEVLYLFNLAKPSSSKTPNTVTMYTDKMKSKQAACETQGHQPAVSRVLHSLVFLARRQSPAN